MLLPLAKFFIMPLIEQTINVPVYVSQRGRVTISLDADKPIDPYHITYPVTWTGIVDGERVEIVQPSSASLNANFFEWPVFPQRLDNLKSDVAQMINRYLHNRMD